MKPFHLELTARWSDMDALNHINHAAYFTYFEQARIAWWHNVGLVLNQDTGPVVIKAEAEYYQALQAPCQLHIHVKAHTPGHSSYWLEYDVYSNEHLYAKGKTKIVWVDYKKNKSVPLPEDMLKHI